MLIFSDIHVRQKDEKPTLVSGLMVNHYTTEAYHLEIQNTYCSNVCE